jgi:hypothetical protein
VLVAAFVLNVPVRTPILFPVFFEKGLRIHMMSIEGSATLVQMPEKIAEPGIQK